MQMDSRSNERASEWTNERQRERRTAPPVVAVVVVVAVGGPWFGGGAAAAAQWWHWVRQAINQSPFRHGSVIALNCICTLIAVYIASHLMAWNSPVLAW